MSWSLIGQVNAGWGTGTSTSNLSGSGWSTAEFGLLTIGWFGATNIIVGPTATELTLFGLRSHVGTWGQLNMGIWAGFVPSGAVFPGWGAYNVTFSASSNWNWQYNQFTPTLGNGYAGNLVSLSGTGAQDSTTHAASTGSIAATNAANDLIYCFLLGYNPNEDNRSTWGWNNIGSAPWTGVRSIFSNLDLNLQSSSQAQILSAPAGSSVPAFLDAHGWAQNTGQNVDWIGYLLDCSESPFSPPPPPVTSGWSTGLVSSMTSPKWKRNRRDSRGGLLVPAYC